MKFVAKELIIRPNVILSYAIVRYVIPLNVISADKNIIFAGTGDIVLGNNDEIFGETASEGVDSNTLSLIDASGLSGNLTMNEVSDVDDADFSFIAGTGVTTMTFFNDGRLDIVPTEKRLVENVLFISPTSGLLGDTSGAINASSPVDKTDKSLSDKKRIRFTCQLDPALKPLSSVYVQDIGREVDGAFKIENVMFLSSSYETGSWIAIVEALEIDGVIGIL